MVPEESQGSRVEAHIEEGYGFHGDAAKPFEAQREVRRRFCDLTEVNEARIAALLDMTTCRSGTSWSNI
jgi:hypothetical protein